ncbi:MAG: hypothetical protein HY862_18890 [Chloroflexi bacterium]|nr:hypothetical protein [Chloroflexota bacterium]
MEENSWQAYCLGCCLFGILFPIGLVYVSNLTQKNNLAVEQWAESKGYKILNKKHHVKFRLELPHKYGRYSQFLLVTTEDKDGLIRTAYIIAHGDKILEAKWDD